MLSQCKVNWRYRAALLLAIFASSDLTVQKLSDLLLPEWWLLANPIRHLALKVPENGDPLGSMLTRFGIALKCGGRMLPKRRARDLSCQHRLELQKESVW